jgi:hypothetical protein
LTELLVVVVVMGLLATTLSGVVKVVLSTTPSAEARADDARSLQGLVTWLPQDVDAAPPDGFDRNPAAWPCAGAAPTDSINILVASWTEQAATATTFATSYRYEKRNGSWSMVRYACQQAGTAKRMNLTSALPAWSSTNPPAKVVMCSVVVKGTWSDQGNCPAADTYPASAYAPTPVRSLKMSITLANGVVSTIDAAPKNPDQSLSDDPNSVANLKPDVANQAFTLSLQQGTTQVYDLANYLGAVNDPDGNNAQLSISIDPSEPAPASYITANAAYTATTQFQLTLTATASATVGTAPKPLMLILSDARGGWRVVTVTIEVTSTVNPAPIAQIASPQTVSLQANVTHVLNVIDIFDIVDDDPTLTVSVTSVTPTAPVVGADIWVTASGPEEITVDLAAYLSSMAPIQAGVAQLTVNDGDGGTLVVDLIISVTPPAAVNRAPTAVRSNVNLTIQAGSSTVVDVANGAGHGVSDPDGDPLSVSVRSVPSGVTATVAGMSVTLAVAGSAAAGATSSPVVLRVADLAGLYVDVTASITITLPPPPPPTCVLQSLTASPNPVARQGSGTGARHLSQNVTVTLTYSGSCDGLRLNYDSGDSSGLGTGPGRTFPPGSPSSILIMGNGTGGTEKFTPGPHVLTASTTTAVTPNTKTTTLNVT